MKNINIYILTAIVSLIMVVATAFLMTAADEPVRQAGYYLPMIFGAMGRLQGRPAGAGLRGAQGSSFRPRRRVTKHIPKLFLPLFPYSLSESFLFQTFLSQKRMTRFRVSSFFCACCAGRCRFFP
jgi:hypothetical protein